MTLDELYTQLKLIDGLNQKVSYRAFNEPTTLPFMVYYETTDNNFDADNKVYVKGTNIVIELYTKDKNRALETNVENKLDSLSLVWSKDELYLSDEKCLEIIYTFNL